MGVGLDEELKTRGGGWGETHSHLLASGERLFGGHLVHYVHHLIAPATGVCRLEDDYVLQDAGLCEGEERTCRIQW